MYEELAQYFGNKLTPVGPNAKDIAKFIVLNADVKSTPAASTGHGSPSLMSRIFDVLSRPNYAVANLIKGSLEGHKNPIADVISGLAGTQKTTFKDVLAAEGMPEGPGRAALGLAMDIGLDPTTYIGPGAIRGAIKGIKELTGAEKAGKAEAELTAKLADKPRQDVLIPTSEAPAGLRNLPIEAPTKVETPAVKYAGDQLQLDLPGVPKIANVSKEAPKVAEKAQPIIGQLPMKFPDFKVNQIRQPAADTIEGLPQNLSRVVPTPRVTYGPRHEIDADKLLGKFRPAVGSDILSRTAQVRLYNQAISQVSSALKRPSRMRRSENALKIYTAAEDKLRRQGFKAPDGVYLSDIISRLGPEAAADFGKQVKEGTPLWQAIEDIKASSAIQDAGKVQNIAESAGRTIKAVEAGNQLSDAQLSRVKDLLKKISTASAKAEDVTPMAVDATTKLVRMAMESGMSRAQIAVEQSKHMIDDIVAKGVANPKANHTQTLALESNLGRLPSWAVTHNKGVEFFMGRVATWWGQSDLRPLSLNQIASSIATAAARGQALDHTFAGLNQAERAEVFRLAQGLPGVPSSPDVHVVAQQVSRMLSNLLNPKPGASVVMRSGTSMDMINKWMKQYKVGFEFVKGKIKNPITGQEVDLSKGNDWLDTWKHVEFPGDCKTCVFKLQQAVEQATREKALYDELGERFGSTVPGKGFTVKIEGHPYLEGYYFPSEIAKQIPRVVRDWTTPGFQAQKGIIGLYDRVLSMWKAGVTIYRPGHHIRNMVGDVYLGWMDGVNSVRPYKLAAQVQRSMNGLYKDLMNVDKIVEMGALGKDFRTPLPGKILFTNKSGVGFTAEQVGSVAHQKGLLEHARTIEDIIDLGGSRGLLDVKPLGGRGQAIARGASELQSHNARLAHFIDKIVKSRGNDLEKIFEEASRRARKWHPTGLDMTQFEKTVMRRIIPFYSWMRKSTPLLIEGLVMNPGKAVIPSKVYEAIQQAQGIETPGRQDPFPVDQMFPEWIRQEGVGPLGKPNEGLLAKFSNQQPPGYTMLGMGLNPLTQMVGQFTDPGRTLATGMTPLFQIPVELMTGKKLFTGEPITGPEARPGAFQQYLGEQIPIYGSLQNVTGVTPFGTETKAAAKSSGDSRIEALMNWLTGAGIRGTGPYRYQARYEMLAPGRMQRKIGREQLAAELRSKLNGSY